MSNDIEFRSWFFEGIKRLEHEKHEYERAAVHATEEKDIKRNLKGYRKTCEHLKELSNIIKYHEKKLKQGKYYKGGA